MKKHLTLILIVIAGFGSAIMDCDHCCYSNSKLKPKKIETKLQKKWDKFSNESSWRNKWKNGDPEQGEKFFGSSTFLVWFTDLFHYAKIAIMLSCLMLAIILYRIYNPFYYRWIKKKVLIGITDFIVFFLVFSCSFELLWRILRI